MRSIALGLVMWFSLGCAIDYPTIDAATTSGAGTSTGTGAITSGGGVGTGGGGAVPPDCDEEVELCLPPPESGFQLETLGDMIQPGQDVEYCEVVQLPGDPSQTYYVNKLEVRMTERSHHLIVSAAVPGSQTEANMNAGDKVKCFTGDVWGGELTSVTGSQHLYKVETFPPGVGKVFRGGQRLVFDYHYLNTTPDPIQARAAVNFHTVDASEVTKVARGFGFYNFGIYIPPGSTKSFTDTCTFSQDILVHKVTRHTHQWGMDFDVSFAGGPKDGQHIWTSSSYEDTDHVFQDPVLMKAGTGFTYRCEFKNTTNYDLKFGVKATDEMCILFGSWFVVQEGQQVPDQGCKSF